MMIDMKPERNPPQENALTRRLQNSIDIMHVQPVQGQFYHLSGPGRGGKGMRRIAEHWVAHALASGQVVHWIDGACRIDPARFIPLLELMGADVESCLSCLYLSRGFTLHQLDKQLQRIPDELAITRSPMVVVDGLLSMHGDDAISPLESRTLLRRHVQMLRELAHVHQTAVVAITATAHSPCTNPRLVKYVKRHAQNHLEGQWRGRRRARTLHLRHRRTGIRGLWQPSHDRSQMRFRLSLRGVNRLKHATKLSVLPLHHRDEQTAEGSADGRLLESPRLSSQTGPEAPMLRAQQALDNETGNP